MKPRLLGLLRGADVEQNKVCAKLALSQSVLEICQSLLVSGRLLWSQAVECYAESFRLNSSRVVRDRFPPSKKESSVALMAGEGRWLGEHQVLKAVCFGLAQHKPFEFAFEYINREHPAKVVVIVPSLPESIPRQADPEIRIRAATREFG